MDRHRPDTTIRRRPSLLIRVASVVAASIALLADSPATAGAQDDAPSPDEAPDAAWAVQPSGPNGPGNRDWFIYTLKPGAAFGDVVAVSNLSDRPIDVIIYASDVEGVADVGGLAPKREDAEPTDVGAWIDLATSEYTIEPGTRIDVPFSVTVPTDAEPGDHVGAILVIDKAEAATDPDASDDVEFQVRKRVGARVYVRVDGEQNPALEITELSIAHDNPVLPTGARATIDWELTNTGNLRLTPTATLKIKGFLGREVKTVALAEIPELLPGGNFVGTAVVDGLPPLERLTAEIEVTAPPDVTTVRSKSFWPVPWLLLLLLLPLGWWLYHGIRRRQRPTADPRTPPPSPEPTRELVDA